MWGQWVLGGEGTPVTTCQAGDRKNGTIEIKQENCSLLPELRLINGKCWGPDTHHPKPSEQR